MGRALILSTILLGGSSFVGCFLGGCSSDPTDPGDADASIGSRPDAQVQGPQAAVINGSFEDDPIATGTYDDDIVPRGWTKYDPSGIIGADYNSIGILNPTGTPLYPAGAPHGNNVLLVFLWRAATDGTPAGLEQTSSLAIAKNTRYTLSVAIGNTPRTTPEPYDLTGFPGYRVELFAAGTVLASDENTVRPAEATFETITVRYDSGPAPALEGTRIGVRLINLNVPNAGIEVNFDAITLTATAS